MIIAIASGKGGTGKTTVAVNLARVLEAQGRRVRLLDCDVEEPNAALFLKPEITMSEPANSPVPRVDEEACTGCGECGRLCQFSAILALGGTVMTFENLCHGCGGCALICPVDAITEVQREIGVIATGRAGGVDFVEGRLNVGEAMSPPVIRQVKDRVDPEAVNLLDAPPGTSCPVVTALEGTDAAVLVTEPTPFGLNDLKLAVETARALEVPFGVVVNRAGSGDGRVEAYLKEEGIPLLAAIPDVMDAARAYSRGDLLVEALEEMRAPFENLASAVLGLAENARPGKEG